MPYPASIIAYAFVKKGLKEGKPVSQMKLQKMVYFAHGYYLAKYREPLIQEDFEAWQFGPVVPAIYSEYKAFGREAIQVTKEHYDAIVDSFPEEVASSIDFTWQVTKNLSAATLSAWTHKKGSPWDKVYKPNGFSIPIDNLTIESFFKEFIGKVAQNQNTTHASPPVKPAN
jgi:uncharacterized phage-associated protein